MQGITTYRLVEGSIISFAPPARDAPDVGPELLSGTFGVVPAPMPQPTPIQGDVIFNVVITAVAFQSAHFTVAGDTGGITVVAIPGQVFMQTSVMINNQTVSLMGTSPLSTVPGELLSGIQISGGGYGLTLFAAPVSGPAAN